MEKMDKETAIAVCNDCHMMKMGPSGLTKTEKFMTCDGCGMKMHIMK